ncbi:hypothetical protein GCM10023082_04180 [Streptomyces tremellae]|uniref:Uncharacterized protein n=1 Tax=Streptomyces tremellae TaxID=1124239 RepID=A0ABP7DRT1_9ACTN
MLPGDVDQVLARFQLSAAREVVQQLPDVVEGAGPPLAQLLGDLEVRVVAERDAGTLLGVRVVVLVDIYTA